MFSFFFVLYGILVVDTAQLMSLYMGKDCLIVYLNYLFLNIILNKISFYGIFSQDYTDIDYKCAYDFI